MHAKRRYLTVVRENHRGHRCQKSNAPLGAVAAAMQAAASGTPADTKCLEAHREPPFQYFRVGEARVGHVGLNRVAAIEPGSGAGTATDGLVILKFIIAEGEIVHGSLARGQNPQGTVERVGDHLGRLHVARDYRRRIVRVHHRRLGQDDTQRPHAAGVHWNFIGHQRAEYIQNRRPGDGLGGVEVIGLLHAGA
jgi:hypothetical protein